MFLFSLLLPVVLAAESNNLANLWQAYRQDAASVSTSESSLKKTITNGLALGDPLRLAAMRDLYLAQLTAYSSYLSWVKEALVTYGDDAGGTVETTMSLAGADDHTATPAAVELSATTQKELYLLDLDQQRQALASFSAQIDTIDNVARNQAFFTDYQNAITAVEESLYPIYSFTLLSSLRDANFALNEYLVLLASALDSLPPSFEVNEQLLVLKNADSALMQISQQITNMEQTWRNITDVTTYDNFRKQISALEGRLVQTNQLLKGVASYVSAQ